MRFYRVPRIFYLVTSAVALCTAGALAEDSPKNPDPRVQNYLATHSGQINSLRKTAEDTSAELDARRRALRQLALISEEEALPTAAKLVSDAEPQIVKDAVQLLANSVVMAGHSGMEAVSNHHTATSNPPSWSKFTEAQHQLVRGALTAASKSPSTEARLDALKALVRFSDEDAIDAVKRAANAGSITQTQAVQLCGQAQGNASRACLIDFLDKGSLEGRLAAVKILGSIPSNRAMIRNKIFLNSGAEPQLRATAAGVLGTYDPDFTSYALTITSDPKTPAAVYAATLQSYASNAQASGKLDSAQWFVLKRALDNKLQIIEESERSTGTSAGSKSLKELRESLDQRIPPN